jgi:hypothetical protein
LGGKQQLGSELSHARKHTNNTTGFWNLGSIVGNPEASVSWITLGPVWLTLIRRKSTMPGPLEQFGTVPVYPFTSQFLEYGCCRIGPLAVADIPCMENEMHFDMTNYDTIIATFALVFIIIFALAPFLDHRWRKTVPLRGFGVDHNPNFPPERDDSDDKDRANNLHLRYADLSARGLDTAKQQITFRGETQQNLEED